MLSLRNEDSESAERGELTDISGMMFLSTYISISLALSKPRQSLSMLAAQPCFSPCNDASHRLKPSKQEGFTVANMYRFSYHQGVEWRLLRLHVANWFGRRECPCPVRTALIRESAEILPAGFLIERSRIGKPVKSNSRK